MDRTIAGAALGTASFGGSDGAFTLKDALVITVKLGPKSWKQIDGLSDTEQQLLLEHEQGHYDIGAIIARDMFIAIMALKGQTFKSAGEGGAALAAVTRRYDGLLTRVDNLYDDASETGHRAFEKLSIGPVRKPAAQARWEGFLKTARTQERTPAVTAPDGASYKAELADVLRGAGLSV